MLPFKMRLEHERKYSLFWKTLRDLSLSVGIYDDKSLEYDTSVHFSNKITYLMFVKKKKRSPVRIEFVT